MASTDFGVILLPELVVNGMEQENTALNNRLNSLGIQAQRQLQLWGQLAKICSNFQRADNSRLCAKSTGFAMPENYAIAIWDA